MIMRGRNITRSAGLALSLGRFSFKKMALASPLVLDFTTLGHFQALGRSTIRFHFWHKILISSSLKRGDCLGDIYWDFNRNVYLLTSAAHALKLNLSRDQGINDVIRLRIRIRKHRPLHDKREIARSVSPSTRKRPKISALASH